jgi:type II secretory pathway component GspD/PulD (secretin)
MSRLWIGFVAACGVIAGTAFACQPGKAAEPVSGHAAVKNAESSKALFAAAPLQPQKPTAGTPDAKPSAEPLTVLKSGPDHIRVVCRLKNHPVTNVNQVLQQLFHLEGGLHKLATASAKGAASSNVAIVPDPITNSLLISGTPEAVEEVQGLLVKLDQPAGMVLLEVEIGTLPVGEAKPVESLPSKEKSPAAKDEPFRLPQRPEKMETTACVRLMTLDNQPAFVHVGSRVPRVASLTVSSPGGETRSTTLANVGLIVGVTPRIDPDGAVVMQIDVEQSQLGPENESSPILAAGRNVVRSPRTDGTTMQTTVRILDAQPLVLAVVTQKGKADKQLVVIVTPHIIRPEAAKKVR